MSGMVKEVVKKKKGCIQTGEANYLGERGAIISGRKIL